MIVRVTINLAMCLLFIPFADNNHMLLIINYKKLNKKIRYNCAAYHKRLSPPIGPSVSPSIGLFVNLSITLKLRTRKTYIYDAAVIFCVCVCGVGLGFRLVVGFPCSSVRNDNVFYFFRIYGWLLHYCSSPNAWLVFYHCPCPPSCGFDSHEYGPFLLSKSTSSVQDFFSVCIVWVN